MENKILKIAAYKQQYSYYICKKGSFGLVKCRRPSHNDGIILKVGTNFDYRACKSFLNYEKNVIYKVFPPNEDGMYSISGIGYIPIDEFKRNFYTGKHLLIEKSYFIIYQGLNIFS